CSHHARSFRRVALLEPRAASRSSNAAQTTSRTLRGQT
ncbi:MAG: hypothetical protein AVDCRST_MAG83-2155, partial [uncultured Arthrobacter sp.]